MKHLLDKISEQMAGCGLNSLPKKLVVDDEIHRFGPKNNSWYVLHTFRLDSGEELIVGRFGDWKLGINVKVDFDMPALSPEQKKAFAAEMRRKELAVANERKRKAAEAAKRASEIWHKLPDSGRSKYLDRKRVRAFGLRFSRGSVVVPLVNIKAQLVGLQFIDGDGNKRFLTGTAKQGAFHLIGEFEADGRLLVAEGYATAASLFMAVGVPVAVAFDAGNLEPVVRAFRSRFPNLHIVVCGDNDHGTAGNPGVAKAQAAAKAVGGSWIVPPAGRDVNAARGQDGGSHVR